MASTINASTSSGLVSTADTSGVLQLQTAGTTAVSIDASQNVGLGVAPSYRFHTASSAFADNVVAIQQGTGQTTGNQNRIQFIDQVGTTGEINSYGSAYGAGYNLGLSIGSNYLNTTALGGSFNYSQNGYSSRYYQVSGQHQWFTAPSGTAGNAITFTQAMTLDASGRLLIAGTSSSNISGQAQNLLVYSSGTNAIGGYQTAAGGYCFASYAVSNGGTYYHMVFSDAETSHGSITSNGTTTSYNVTSDQRLKENIVDAPEFGSVIDSLQVRSFDWKSDNTHQRAGFVAQELVTVAPEAVHQPVDPEEMMAVDYSKLVPMLVKEIQSLRIRIAQLEAK